MSPLALMMLAPYFWQSAMQESLKQWQQNSASAPVLPVRIIDAEQSKGVQDAG